MRSQGKQNNADGKKSEEKSVKLYGRKTPGSGSGNSKLDIIGEGAYDGLRFENKWTGADSKSIKLEDLEKARIQASKHSTDWAFIVDFQHLKRYVLTPEAYFVNIHEHIQDLEGEIERLNSKIRELNERENDISFRPFRQSNWEEEI